MGECVNAISIHAPTKGATRDYAPYTTFKAISIHAPTKGATLTKPVILVDMGFQSTLPRRERRFYRIIKFLQDIHFNPRSHEGSDNALTLCKSNSTNFNPRSHEGSDGEIPIDANIISISIHAPTKGAT